jgi:hypothetical protein
MRGGWSAKHIGNADWVRYGLCFPFFPSNIGHGWRKTLVSSSGLALLDHPHPRARG